MEKSKKVAALKAAAELFQPWFDLCACYGIQHKVICEDIYPILLINPLWSAQYEGFGSHYPLSDEDDDGVRWIIIFKHDKFDPELYDHILEAWKFHHQVK